MANPPHISVLLKEAIDRLDIKPDGVYLDATCGAGGHAKGICEKLSTKGRLIGIDRDKGAIKVARKRLAPFDSRAILNYGKFSMVDRILDDLKIESIDGALADLGISSMQLDNPGRGFSFESDVELDMRMDPETGITVAQLLRSTDVGLLARIFRDYGEQPLAKRIAKAVSFAAQEEKPMTGRELRQIVHGAIPAKMRRKARIDPATRVFMALRIAVNEELTELETFLEKVVPKIVPGGRLVIISFHSLEDRIVKRFFLEQARGCTCPREFPVCVCGKSPILKILTRKPVQPEQEEKERNPRARSARLRAAEKLP